MTLKGNLLEEIHCFNLTWTTRQARFHLVNVMTSNSVHEKFCLALFHKKEVLFQIIPFVVGQLFRGRIVKNPSKYEAWTITCNPQASTTSVSDLLWSTFDPFLIHFLTRRMSLFCSLLPVTLLYQSTILLNCAMDYNLQPPEDKRLLEYSTNKRSQTSQELGIFSNFISVLALPFFQVASEIKSRIHK